MKTWRELIADIKHEDMDKPVFIKLSTPIITGCAVEELVITLNCIDIIPSYKVILADLNQLFK